MIKKFSADFETATWNPDMTWVWAWCIAEIGNESNIHIDNNIDSFFEFCKSENNPVLYFHNLKFDGEFIIYWLLKNGFKHIENSKEIADNTFTTLISDVGQFYSIVVYFKKGNKKVKKVTFYDSLKILPFSVDQIAKSFSLPISKLKIDYNKEREIGHVLTKEEIEYIQNDVLIVAKALKVVFDEKLTKMTQAGNALFDYKEIIGKNRFEHFFPSIDKEVDSMIRKSYKGGFTYLNPCYKEKEVGKGVVLDVNSLYPSCMYEKKLPYGYGEYFEGKYENDKIFDLYIQRFTCSFELKKDKIPTIQIKNSKFFIGNEYLENSNNEIVCLTLTNVDLDLFFEHYNVFNITYLDGYKFKSIKGLFTKYIDKWTEKKIQAGKEGNKGQRQLAKLMLNGLYGKFAKSLEIQAKIPYLEDDVVKYKLGEKEDTKGIYIPVGSFITAYAREKTIRTSQSIKEYSLKTYGVDMYCYSDTDSIHTTLPKDDLEKFVDIDDFELRKMET